MFVILRFLSFFIFFLFKWKFLSQFILSQNFNRNIEISKNILEQCMHLDR